MPGPPVADHAIQVYIDEVEARCRPPVTEQPRLHILQRERLSEQRIGEQIDLPD
jgi:hypothetical protein